MDLLEREPILAELDRLLHDAAGGTGRIAAVSGEAGAGKTSLVEQFIAAHRGRVRVLSGLCDPLSTPRPLGPVHDMAEQTTGPLATALVDGTSRDGLFSAFLAELGRVPMRGIELPCRARSSSIVLRGVRGSRRAFPPHAEAAPSAPRDRPDAS
jgi:predicted ATPase